MEMDIKNEARGAMVGMRKPDLSRPSVSSSNGAVTAAPDPVVRVRGRRVLDDSFAPTRRNPPVARIQYVDAPNETGDIRGAAADLDRVDPPMPEKIRGEGLDAGELEPLELSEFDRVPTEPFPQHWHEMWVEVAMKLWTGALRPRSREDLTHAMHEWLATRQLEHFVLEAYDCARMLWRQYITTKRVNCTVSGVMEAGMQDGGPIYSGWPARRFAGCGIGHAGESVFPGDVALSLSGSRPYAGSFADGSGTVAIRPDTHAHSLVAPSLHID